MASMLSSSMRSLAPAPLRINSRCRSSASSETSARRTSLVLRSVTNPDGVRKMNAILEGGPALVVH